MRSHRGDISWEVSQNCLNLFAGESRRPRSGAENRKTCYCVPADGCFGGPRMARGLDDAPAFHACVERIPRAKAKLPPDSARKDDLPFAGNASLHRDKILPCHTLPAMPSGGRPLARTGQARIRRRPLGCGIGSPNSLAVSIQRRIASCALPRALSCVAPWAAHPGSSGTSATNALSSSLQ